MLVHLLLSVCLLCEMYVATQPDGFYEVLKSISMAPLVKLPGERLIFVSFIFGVGRWGVLGYGLYVTTYDSLPL